MSDLEGDDLALLERFTKRASDSRHGRKAKEAKSPVRRTPGSGRYQQMNLKVRPEWKLHLMNLARDDRRSMVEILEIGVDFYERNREALK